MFSSIGQWGAWSSIRRVSSWIYGSGNADEEDPFSAATLLADRAQRRSDPTIYENAIKILGISDEVTLEHADQRHQFLVTELQRKLSRASKPLAACFQAQIADVEAAYQTVRATFTAST